MWIMTRFGFFSAVEHRAERSTLIVRARKREHLERLSRANPVTEFLISDTPKADYPFRTFIDREEWGRILNWLNYNTDYGNFKNAVAADKENTSDYIGFLEVVWSLGRLDLQERPKKNGK